MTSTTEPIYPIDQIPSGIGGHEFSPEEINRLSHGLPTHLISDISLNDEIFDAKVSVKADKDGKLFLLFDPYRETLDIPDTILGINLTDEQKESLKTGQEIGPFEYKNEIYYFAQDKDLNLITIRTPEQFGVRDVINGYELSQSDKDQLKKSDILSTRVFKGEDTYFSAQLQTSIQEDGTVKYTFHQYNEISNIRAMSLIQEFNVDLAAKEQRYFKAEKLDSKLTNDPVNEAFNHDKPHVELDGNKKEKSDNVTVDPKILNEEEKRSFIQFLKEVKQAWKESGELAKNPIVQELYKAGKLKDIMRSGNVEEGLKKLKAFDKDHQETVTAKYIGKHIVQLVKKEKYSDIKDLYSGSSVGKNERVIGHILDSKLSGEDKIAALSAIGAEDPAKRLIKFEKNLSKELKKGGVQRVPKKSQDIVKEISDTLSKKNSSRKLKEGAMKLDNAIKSTFNNM